MTQVYAWTALTDLDLPTVLVGFWNHLVMLRLWSSVGGSHGFSLRSGFTRRFTAWWLVHLQLETVVDWVSPHKFAGLKASAPMIIVRKHEPVFGPLRN